MPVRKALGISVACLFALALIAFASVLVASMYPTERERNNASVILKLEALQPGEFRKIFVAEYGRTLFVFRPTQEVMADLKKLDAHVWDCNLQAYDKDHEIFIYWGESTKTGVQLERIAKGSSRFTEPGHVWLGGYFDLMHDPSYDYAGRTIKYYEYTYNGYDVKHPNMKVPKYEFLRDGNLLIQSP